MPLKNSKEYNSHRNVPRCLSIQTRTGLSDTQSHTHTQLSSLRAESGNDRWGREDLGTSLARAPGHGLPNLKNSYVVHVYIHVHIHILTHAHTHTYTQTHTQAQTHS